MAGLGVFIWLGIGAGAGWIISWLMVGPEDDALRGTAAGMTGGVLGGLALRLLTPPGLIGSLEAALAALAGALWLTWVACVVTSGRAPELGNRRPPLATPMRSG